MIESESPPETLMQLSDQLRQALSWKLVAELHRRHPEDFTVIETHPGGGLYDCLTLMNGEDEVANLNRLGSFRSKDQIIEWADLWPAGLAEGGIADLLERMSRACGLTVPSKLPPTSPETLTYRIMAGVAAAFAFEKDVWEWRNGQEVNSVCGDQTSRDPWFEAVPGAKEAALADSMHQLFGNSKFGFWFLLKNGRPTLCISKTAVCWSGLGGNFDLAEVYNRERCIYTVLGVLLTLLK